eukprot:TRINITY_DN64291_c0_g1_i3.p1 TRINITY_DN64291_c0_g1~~TRINITY_DN64291_c0_g1_i3.p1  ORF type:complete len:244 (-),score=15.21 TRINITY_DN64291_c0_g1_i3:37-768(-)
MSDAPPSPSPADAASAATKAESSDDTFARDEIARSVTADDFGVIFQTPELLIINKPNDVYIDGEHDNVSLTVQTYVAQEHPKKLENGGKLRFIHQLDFATSGVLCLGFTRKATGRIGKCFEQRTTTKWYSALVYGHPAQDTAELTWDIAEDPSDERGFRMCIGTDEIKGRNALTKVTVVTRGYYRGSAASHVVLQPKTGRRHQLRVHLKEWGHSIVGDYTYSKDDPNIPRMFLHAWKLRCVQT